LLFDEFRQKDTMLTLSPETEALVRARAAMAGKTADQVIREALGAATSPPKKAKPTLGKASLAEILAIAERSAARPLLDPRTPEEIIGYDDHGLPK
jgi:antitoxin VapB